MDYAGFGRILVFGWIRRCFALIEDFDVEPESTYSNV